MYKLSQRSLERRAGVDPRLIEICDLAIKITIIDFGIPRDGGVRTAQRQLQLYQDGSSRADGTKHKSRHQSGKALDFYAYVDGSASWEREHLAIVACAFFEASSILDEHIRWGGLFKSFTDMPHIELLD